MFIVAIFVFFVVYYMCLTIGNDSVNQDSVPEAIMLHVLSIVMSIGVVVILFN